MRTFRLIQNSMLVFCFLLCSCSKDDKPEEKKEKTLAEIIIGSWIEQPPYHDGRCDTLVLKSDGKIDNYIPLVGTEYIIISKDSMVLKDSAFRNVYIGLDIELTGDSLLKIYNFFDRKATADEKNITFKKMK